MIKCKICGKEYNKMIPRQHMKLHGISYTEYKESYGDVVSKEFKEVQSKNTTGSNNGMHGRKHRKESKDSMSKNSKGRVAHNKGVPMGAEQREILSFKAKERNRKWKETGTHPLLGKNQSEETKRKIRKARKKQVIKPESVKKAVETRKKRGYPGGFKGKKHSESTRKRLRDVGLQANKAKSERSMSELRKRLSDHDLTFVSRNGRFITISCNACGLVATYTRGHLSKSKIDSFNCKGCIESSWGTSQQEKDFADFVSQSVDIKRNDRKLLNRKEVDVLVEDHKLCFEYDGLHYHSLEYKDKNYHSMKTDLANDKGYRLFHVYEDEWTQKQPVVKSKVMSILCKYDVKLDARKCSVGTVLKNHAEEFFIENDLNVHELSFENVMGLWHDGELVMAFSYYCVDGSTWKIERLCTRVNTTDRGGASKLFSHFIRHTDPQFVITVSDRRWTDCNSVYKRLGFSVIDVSDPVIEYFAVPKLQRTLDRGSVGQKVPKCQMISNAGHITWKWER